MVRLDVSRRTRSELNKYRLSDVAFKSLRDLILRHSTHNLFYDLPILEYQQGGDTPDVELARGVHCLIDV